MAQKKGRFRRDNNQHRSFRVCAVTRKVDKELLSLPRSDSRYGFREGKKNSCEPIRLGCFFCFKVVVDTGSEKKKARENSGLGTAVFFESFVLLRGRSERNAGTHCADCLWELAWICAGAFFHKRRAPLGGLAGVRGSTDRVITSSVVYVDLASRVFLALAFFSSVRCQHVPRAFPRGCRHSGERVNARRDGDSLSQKAAWHGVSITSCLAGTPAGQAGGETVAWAVDTWRAS